MRTISSESIAVATSEAVAAVHSGGVIMCPTDTLYCLAGDALRDTTVDRIYEIKGRDLGKRMHALVYDIDMAARYGEISDHARAFIRACPPGTITLIVPKKHDCHTGILRDSETFGFRIPSDELCQAILRQGGVPLTATSANKSGLVPEQQSAIDIIKQLGAMASSIDLIIDGGVIPMRLPSTVVDLTGEVPIVLREGAIAIDMLRELGLLG